MGQSAGRGGGVAVGIFMFFVLMAIVAMSLDLLFKFGVMETKDVDGGGAFDEVEERGLVQEEELGVDPGTQALDRSWTGGPLDGWTELTGEGGDTYYYNTKTKVTQWDKPTVTST